MRGDTICALCTPQGKGALSLIRVSGPKALTFVKPLAPFLPLKIETHKAYVGALINKEELLDKAVVTYFKKGKSFTGEETLEISCHGGEFIFHKILSALQQKGVRLAERGEFSLRSFLNGQYDLVQAEGILQLIESKNSVTHKAALSQLRGKLSKTLKEIEKTWLYVLSHIEADIDFSLEDISVLNSSEFEKEILSLKNKTKTLLVKYKPFEELQKGLNVGLFGLVNAGKSTLFNSLLNEDKAIVTDEEGTTRDPIEGKLFSPNGLNLSLKDTAGLRKTKKKAEQMGQEKTRDLLSSCAVSLFVVEWGEEALDQAQSLVKESGKKTLLVFTKKDLSSLSEEDVFLKIQKEAPSLLKIFSKKEIFFVSAKTKENLNSLKNYLLSLGAEEVQEEFFVANERHFNELKKMSLSLEKALALLTKKGERDLIALELREGLSSLYKITGQEFNEQILDKIFNQFCIGK